MGLKDTRRGQGHLNVFHSADRVRTNERVWRTRNHRSIMATHSALHIVCLARILLGEALENLCNLTGIHIIVTNF